MTDHDSEHQLRARMDRTAANEFAPDGLSRAALNQGRRLQRRRRATWAAGSLAALTVVGSALIVPALAGGDSPGGPDGRGPDPVDHGIDAATTRTPAAPDDGFISLQELLEQQGSGPSEGAPPSTDPKPSATLTKKGEGTVPPSSGTARSAASQGWWSMPGVQIVDTLETLLPDGVDVATRLRQDANHPGDAVSAIRSTVGANSFQLRLHAPEEGRTLSCDGVSASARIAKTCRPLRDERGEPIGYTNSFDYGGHTENIVEIGIVGGPTVEFWIANSLSEKPGPDSPTSSPSLLLTIDQMRTIVEDPSWRAYRPR